MSTFSKCLVFPELFAKHCVPYCFAGILFAQLTLTTIIGASIVFQPGVKAFITATPALTLLAAVVSMGTLLAFCFSTQARNQHPLNLVLLGVFTAAEGVRSCIPCSLLSLVACGMY